jgi:hypothetical protein
MERKLHLLESYQVTGSDGRPYKVCGYEQMTRDESLADGAEHWEPTGMFEYRLATGELLEPHKDGTMRVPKTGVMLPAREQREPAVGAT